MTPGNPLGDDPYLTVYEIAEPLKLNQQTVRNWTAFPWPSGIGRVRDR